MIAATDKLMKVSPLLADLSSRIAPRSSNFLLGTTLLKTQTPAVDSDRPVSRRSEPSSRTILTGEQPDAWELLHPRAMMSRHRGAEHDR